MRNSVSCNARAVLIADAQLENLDQLLSGLDADIEPWLVAPDQDALPLIFAALGQSNLTQLHVLAHGAPGEIQLGRRTLTAADFQIHPAPTDFQIPPAPIFQRGDLSVGEIGRQKNVSIAFWSCHTGAGVAGAALNHAITAATGAQVFLAQGLIGAAAQQGSWEINGLTAPFNAAARNNFTGTLATRDRFEDNDFIETATNLGTISGIQIETGLSIETDDPDWFQFTLPSTGVVDSSVAIDFDNAQGDLDIFLYNAGYESLGGTYSSNDHEQLSLTGLAAGTYFVKVRDWTSMEDGENPNYTLTIKTSTVVVDDYAGDTATTGTIAINGVTTGAIETAADEDWFRVNLTADHNYTVILSGTYGGGGSLVNPYVLLLDSTGSYVKYADGSLVHKGITDGSGDAQIAFTPTLSGTYYVDASSNWLDETGTYLLSVTEMIPATLSLSSLNPSSITEGNNGSTAMTVNITRSGDLSGTASANWSVTGGTANAVDFLNGILPAGSVYFAAGQTTATANINIAGDTTVEADETFTVMLSNPLGATLKTYSAVGTIRNDDIAVTNHAPIASNKTLEIAANVVTTLTLADFGFKDVDSGDTLQSITVDWLPSLGQFSLNGVAVTENQVIKAIDIAAGKLTFLSERSGDPNFGFSVSDGKAVSVTDYTFTFNISGGSDPIEGTPNNDMLHGDSNNNQFNGLAGNDTLLGFAGKDTLDGGIGNDWLNGGNDADNMNGGSGNDVYYVDNVGDTITELKTGGIDIVYSSLANYTLGANLENGRLITTKSANLTGNALDNLLIAGPGNNVLNGGIGNDTASYAFANKAVMVSLARADMQITGGSGSDRLISIENLIGSKYNDKLIGNAEINILEGGAGNDKLTGGDGSDTFYFNTRLSMTNRDTITDFQSADDVIALDNAIFTQLEKTGVLNPDYFYRDDAKLPIDADDFIQYHVTDGSLYYDVDGVGVSTPIQFAIIGNNQPLTAGDFFVM